MYKSAIISALSLSLVACSGANVTSQIRDFDKQSSSKMIRCETFGTGSSSTNEKLEKYDGWSMVYASEYTTENKSTTEMTMCFEKLNGNN
ncbi:hypothetical protein [Enterovibrio paralichthyis]|uniref:hypothetical protein n=1 Tax=Enterovibrio paralichthyis TaxID=2853805 RepID=UPI001C43C56B|nr:hypothetical protein [Enterovibrio paralichthyis]MBV7299934.1 hypothetical protein [Enterovibrio paralichthyis]